MSGTFILYSRIYFTKSPASSSGKVSEPRLMPQVGGVRKVVCAISVCVYVCSTKAVEVTMFVFLRSSCSNVAMR
jgi:hypothetical protein